METDSRKDGTSMQASWIKRTAAGSVALLMALSLAACSNGEEPGSAPGTQSTAPSVQINTTEPTTTTTTAEAFPLYCWNIADTSINIRPEPNTDKEAIGGMAKGERAQVLGKEGDWYKIQILSLVGYVSGQYLSFTDPALGTTNAADTAVSGETTVATTTATSD